MLNGFVCLTPGCRRRPPGNAAICNACARWIPTETKLALQGHHDAVHNCHCWGVPNQLNNPDKAAWAAFVAWSHLQTIRLAALQAWEAMPGARSDPETLGARVRLHHAVGLQ